jgi:glycosyltransferase involved in cell wall biosynthesis
VDSPLVSILMSVRNNMPHVRDAVESVLAQTYPHWELVIQDGASTDGTTDYLRTLTATPAISVVSEPDSGQGQGFNRAMKRSRGGIIGSVDGDNRLKPDAIEVGVRALAAHPGAAVVYGACDMVDTDGRFLHTFVPAEFDLLGLLDGSVVPPFGSSFFSREQCGAQLYADEDFPVVPDFAMWLRLSNLKILRVPDVMMDVRAGPQSSTYTPGSYDQQTHYKLLASRRFLAGKDAPAVDVLARRAEAGIYLWAVDSMQVIGGPRERIDEYFAKAVHCDIRSERFRAVVTRAQPRLHALDADLEDRLLQCALDFVRIIQPEPALVYLELLERSGSTLPQLPGLIGEARRVAKEIHLSHCMDVIDAQQAEIDRRDALLATEIGRRDRLHAEEIAIRDRRLVEMHDHLQGEVNLRDRLLEEARNTWWNRMRDRLRLSERLRGGSA